MVKKDLHTELRELEERKKQIEKELETKRKIAEKEAEDKRKSFEEKVWKIFGECEGMVIDDWYDYDSLGHDVIDSLSKEGHFYWNWEEELEKAIKNTEEYLKEKQEIISNHHKRLKDFLKKLKELNQKGVELK